MAFPSELVTNRRLADCSTAPAKTIDMPVIKRLLIGLDLSSNDDHLIEYAAFLARRVQAEKAFFIHVIQKDDEDIELDRLQAAGEQEHHSLEETVRRRMQAEIDKHFAYLACEAHLELKDGNVAQSLLTWTRYIEPDLLLMGMKNAPDDYSKVPSNVVRLINRPMMLIPVDTPKRLHKVVVATDFSQYTAECIDEVRLLADPEDYRILLAHAYRLPSGYHRSGKSEREFCRIMEDNARKKADEFFDEYDIDPTHIELEVIQADDSKAAAIGKRAHEIQADLLVMGSRGRTQIAEFLLGSTAAKFINLHLNIPLLIVKNRKGSMDFLDALRNI